MAERHINPVTVLKAIEAGDDTRAKLAERFGVDPGVYALRSALNELEHHRHITVDRSRGLIESTRSL